MVDYFRFARDPVNPAVGPHCARLLTESQHCNAIRMAAKRMEVQSPSPPRAACIFSSWEVGQSTVMRVPAVVPVTSTDGVPVPKTLVASKTLKSKLPL